MGVLGFFFTFLMVRFSWAKQHDACAVASWSAEPNKVIGVGSSPSIWGDYMESPYTGKLRGHHEAYVTKMKTWILESNHRRKSRIWRQIRTTQDV